MRASSTTHDDFAHLAPFYDLVTLPIRSLRRRVVRLAGVHTGDRVLDVATGTGAQAFAFAAAGANVVGVDMSPAMLDVARRHNHLANVSFLEADASELPLADASFDIACISFGLHEMPTAARYEVLCEMVRVTRPGGTIVAVDYVLPSNALAAASIERVVRSFEREHYVGFVHEDMRTMLDSAGIVVEADHRAVLGAIRIMVGKTKNPD